MASAPIGIAFVLYLLLLIPVLRILAPLTEPRIRTLLYVLSVFYALEGLHLLVHLSPFFGRALFALIVLTALVILGRLARPSRLRSMTMQGRNHRIFVIGIRACLADRKSTRLNSSHRCISYAVFCLKKTHKS